MHNLGQTPHGLALRHALESLAIDFWHLVDFEGAAGAADWYTEDGVFTSSARTYRGRAELQGFYARKSTQLPRVSVHVLHNFRIAAEEADGVRCHYLLNLYAADGEPVLPSRPAVMLARVEELLRRHAGGWLCASREVFPLFRDGTATRG